jgi:HTH-type transcriptional regulator, sugar sensing transcriptional regulator
MKKSSLESVLIAIGLTEAEASLYLAMLANGPSSVLHLARASGLHRTSIYGYLEHLKDLGVVRIDVHGFKRLFVAEPPEHLHQLVTHREQLLKKHMGDFEALYQNQSSVSFIRYYEGINAIKEVYESLLKEAKRNEYYLIFSDQEGWVALDPEYFTKFQERRAKLTLDLRLILQDSPTARRSHKFQKNLNASIKLLPPETKLSTNLIITPRKIVIHQLKSPTLAIVIENEPVIRMHKEMYDIAWNALGD